MGVTPPGFEPDASTIPPRPHITKLSAGRGNRTLMTTKGRWLLRPVCLPSSTTPAGVQEVVGMGGVEPPRYFYHQILSLARLRLRHIPENEPESKIETRS